MPKTFSYITDQPTQHFGIPRMRVDMVERLKSLAKVKKVTLNELVNHIVENGLNQLEGIEKRKQAYLEERERIRKTLKGEEENEG